MNTQRSEGKPFFKKSNTQGKYGVDLLEAEKQNQWVDKLSFINKDAISDSPRIGFLS